MAGIFTGSADGLGIMAAELLIRLGHAIVLNVRSEASAKEISDVIPRTEAKDERAISGYVVQGHKIVTYKRRSKNHLMDQVESFRVKDNKREDDLLDTFCYGIANPTGNSEGFWKYSQRPPGQPARALGNTK
jgi:hypothetical protein